MLWLPLSSLAGLNDSQVEAEREAGGQRAGQAQGAAAKRQAELLRLELELKGLQADQAEAQASASAATAAKAEALQSQAGLPNHSLQKTLETTLCGLLWVLGCWRQIIPGRYSVVLSL